ncbi:hypothetical protein AMECASPLE_031901 [Ameca splendens]|uniref:Uncharacterized protein n=1 Tax=Ameca splendens TaxID=208324 RepID=A0ABV1ACU7_9TELE
MGTNSAHRCTGLIARFPVNTRDNQLLGLVGFSIFSIHLHLNLAVRWVVDEQCRAFELNLSVQRRQVEEGRVSGKVVSFILRW